MTAQMTPSCRHSLEHQLASGLTILVAVDKMPSRPEGEALKLSELPLNLPAGLGFRQALRRALTTADSAATTACRRRRCQGSSRGGKTASPCGRADIQPGHAVEDSN